MTFQAFIRPAARPALAPILFPATREEMLIERYDAIQLATYAVKQTSHHFRFAAQQISRANRLDARIAQVAK